MKRHCKITDAEGNTVLELGEPVVEIGNETLYRRDDGCIVSITLVNCEMIVTGVTW